MVLTPSGDVGRTVRNTCAGGWNQFSPAPFQSVASAVEIRIGILSILDHGSKSNLQSAQLLICQELVSGRMYECVHLFSTVLLVGTGQSSGDCTNCASTNGIGGLFDD